MTMMIIDGQIFELTEVFPKIITVPDSFVKRDNKIRTTDDLKLESHGEAKLYISSKEDLHSFYGGRGFSVSCFVLKQDLIDYLNILKHEYTDHFGKYRGNTLMPTLWNNRLEKVRCLQSDVLPFKIFDQDQIAGKRGYVNSSDLPYQLIREIALPLVSFILVKKLQSATGESLFYWKLFVDFDALSGRVPLVYSYGKASNVDVIEHTDPKIQIASTRKGRDGQQKYRERLLDQCPFCPITMVSDDRLLIASHIKPWSVSSIEEQTDPYNGYMFTPTYDRLFDQGFITFTDDKRMLVSDYLSKNTCKQLNLVNGRFIKALPMDEKRVKYLEYHNLAVFKK